MFFGPKNADENIKKRQKRRRGIYTPEARSYTYKHQKDLVPHLLAYFLVLFLSIQMYFNQFYHFINLFPEKTFFFFRAPLFYQFIFWKE